MSCHWGLLNADDLVVIAKSKEELSKKRNRWKDGVRSKGMKVDMYKTNVTVSEESRKGVHSTGRWRCLW